MAPSLRVSLVVACAAAAAAGATVGATLLTSSGEGGSVPAPPAQPRAGAPPLVLDLGVRVDSEARALHRASLLYDRGRRAAAGRIFRRYRSLEAEMGAAFSAWPEGFAEAERLAREHPRSGLVQLHLGLALYWMGRTPAAQAAWRSAKRVEPDSGYAVRAADLLHPEDPVPGLPVFVPSFRPPRSLSRLSPLKQLVALAARAQKGGVRDKLLYGIALQRLSRPISAERLFATAAALAPANVEALVAAAVGRFDKDAPERAFSRLGPLTRAYPHAPTVRFHLGLLLLWLDRIPEAERQLRLARAEGPATPIGREAARFLARLNQVQRKRST